MHNAAAGPPIVLLIEDSEDDVFFFRRALRATGIRCELVHVADGTAAVQHFERMEEGRVPPPDLVFMDLKIPVVSGFEVLEWIRSRKPDLFLDIAVLSGSEHAGDIERAFALGASAYYVKPVLFEQLKSRLNAWKERRIADQSLADAHAAVGPEAPV